MLAPLSLGAREGGINKENYQQLCLVQSNIHLRLRILHYKKNKDSIMKMLFKQIINFYFHGYYNCRNR